MTTSSESIGTDPLDASGEPSGSFDKLQGDDADPSSPKDEAKVALESDVQALKDKLLEERFVWIVICVILVDVLWFRNAPNAVLPILVFILEAIVLFIDARRMGIQEVSALFERVIHSLGQRGTGG